MKLSSANENNCAVQILQKYGVTIVFFQFFVMHGNEGKREKKLTTNI
jgi:hypothetical protein